MIKNYRYRALHEFLFRIGRFNPLDCNKIQRNNFGLMCIQSHFCRVKGIENIYSFLYGICKYRSLGGRSYIAGSNLK